MALLQHPGSETEEELNENRFPCLLCVTSDYLTGEYEQQRSVCSGRCCKSALWGHFNSEMELECMCMHTHTWCAPVKRMSKRVALAQRFHVDATGVWVRPGRVEACFYSFR